MLREGVAADEEWPLGRSAAGSEGLRDVRVELMVAASATLLSGYVPPRAVIKHLVRLA